MCRDRLDFSVTLRATGAPPYSSQPEPPSAQSEFSSSPPLPQGLRILIRSMSQYEEIWNYEKVLVLPAACVRRDGQSRSEHGFGGWWRRRWWSGKASVGAHRAFVPFRIVLLFLGRGLLGVCLGLVLLLDLFLLRVGKLVLALVLVLDLISYPTPSPQPSTAPAPPVSYRPPPCTISLPAPARRPRPPPMQPPWPPPRPPPRPPSRASRFSRIDMMPGDFSLFAPRACVFALG